MRPRITPFLLAALLVSSYSWAQDPHFGVALDLVIPTGGFSSTTYPPTQNLPVPETKDYDLGLGAKFFISFPVDPKLAFRLEFMGQSETGQSRAEGYESLDLRHDLFGIGAEVEVFLGTGSAYRHKGTYLLGGITADFEKFSWNSGNSYYDTYGYYDNWDSQRKSRMGVLAGLGHSFGYGGGSRFTMEAVYHKTLTNHDINAGDPPSTDFLRLGFGWVF